MRIKCRPMTADESPAVTLTDNTGTQWAVLCGWMSGCKRDATGTTPHPVLGDVPTCDKCHKFATA
jgi:hypothetical protein